MQVQMTGIGWYRREDYEALRSIFTDGQVLPRTYEEWLSKAEAVEERLKKSGMRVVRAHIDPIENVRRVNI